MLFLFQIESDPKMGRILRVTLLLAVMFIDRHID